MIGEPGQPSQNEIAPISRRLLLGDHADLDLREFYLQTRIGRGYLALGKQQIVWGEADGLKVLDVVNPQDFREFILDNFDDSRIPLWAVNAELPMAEATLQLIWLPDRSYHRLPEPEALFAFTAPFLVPSPPPGVAAEVRKIKRPGRVIADSDVGARLTAFWRGWDLSLNYLYHYFDIPVLFQSLAMTPSGPVATVTPRYRRTHLIGGTFSNAFGDLTVRGELGYSTDRFFLVDDPFYRDGVGKSDELNAMLGFDWYGFEDTVVSLQLFESWVIDKPRGLVRDEFDTTLTLFMRRNFMNEALEADVMWLQNLNRGDGLVRPKLSYELRDNLKIWTGMDLFYGDREGLFGQFNNNDRVIIGLERGL